MGLSKERAVNRVALRYYRKGGKGNLRKRGSTFRVERKSQGGTEKESGYIIGQQNRVKEKGGAHFGGTEKEIPFGFRSGRPNEICGLAESGVLKDPPAERLKIHSRKGPIQEKPYSMETLEKK